MIKSSAVFIVYSVCLFRLLKEMDQRICIKFCVKNEIKCNKVCEMLTKAYGESAMSKTRVYEWYKRFQNGRIILCFKFNLSSFIFLMILFYYKFHDILLFLFLFYFCFNTIILICLLINFYHY